MKELDQSRQNLVFHLEELGLTGIDRKSGQEIVQEQN